MRTLAPTLLDRTLIRECCALKQVLFVFGSVMLRLRSNNQAPSMWTNYKQYKMTGLVPDVMVCDMAHTPLRESVLFDGIVADRNTALH